MKISVEAWGLYVKGQSKSQNEIISHMRKISERSQLRKSTNFITAAGLVV